MEDMQKWILEGAKATMAAISSAAIIDPEVGDAEDYAAAVAFLTSPLHSRSVKTIIIITHNLLPEDGSFLKFYEEELCSRVKEWGLDGLLFTLQHDVGCLQILESLAALPSCTALCITHGRHTSPWPMEVTRALCDAINRSPSLTHLYLRSSSDVDTAPLPEEALLACCSGSVQSLSIEASLCSETTLIPILTSSSCSLKSLSITSSNDSFLKSLWSLDLVRNICSKLAANTIDLHSLSFVHYCSNGMNDFSQAVVTRKVWFMLGTMLKYNRSLTSFSLYNFRLPEEAVRCLFASVEKNDNLTYLSMAQCSVAQCSGLQYGLESGNRLNVSVLGSLQVNTGLREVNLIGTPLQNDNAIRAELLMKKGNTENREASKWRPSALVQPTTVRLLCCGLLHSGKTTFSRSVANWNRKAASSAG